jgi:hypothetical protein
MLGMTGKPEIRGPYTITDPEGSTVEDIESAWR